MLPTGGVAPTRQEQPMTNPNPCTCWQVTDETGHQIPLTYAALHDAVRIHTNDGRTYEGWTLGAEWVHSPTGVEALVFVEDNEQPSFLTKDDIATVTPLGRHDRLLPLLNEVADRLMESPDAETFVRLFIDHHHSIDIELRRVTHACTPGPPPYEHTAKPVC